MSQVNKETIYKSAIMTYGEIAQIDVAIEEMSELIQALSKYKRGKEHNVEEEIADVCIMMDQLKLIFDNRKVQKIKRRKIARLGSRLQNDNSAKYIGKKVEKHE